MGATWEDAVSALKAATSRTTKRQRAIAEAVGFQLPSTVPVTVAAALLREELHADLLTSETGDPTEYQQQTLKDLVCRLGLTRVPRPSSRGQASAWIMHYYMRLRMQALNRLKPEVGDIAEKITEPDIPLTISSIAKTGRLHFHGQGLMAWPDQVRILAKARDSSQHATQLRHKARNHSSVESGTWSLARQRSLEPFLIGATVAIDDVHYFEEVVEQAADERPIQAAIQERPQLLTSLLGGTFKYLIPQQKLANKYVTDFLLADYDSRGLRWLLVELETPLSGIALKSRNQFDEHARQGIAQIDEWRNWLGDNRHVARATVHDNGLGLHDIRADEDGLVLVGRRQRLLPRASQIRKQKWEQSRIGVHTYDWLLEQLYAIYRFSGPPASNPHLLHRGASLNGLALGTEDDPFDIVP